MMVVMALRDWFADLPRFCLVLYFALLPAMIYGAALSLVWEPLGWAIGVVFLLRVLYVGYYSDRAKL